MKLTRLSLYAAVLGLALLGGCATKAPPYDYTAFGRAKPATLLVMPAAEAQPLQVAPKRATMSCPSRSSTRPFAKTA